MADPNFPAADSEVFNRFIRAQALALRAKDQPAPTRSAWEERRSKLRAAMFEAMGPFPEAPCPLEPKIPGVLKRDGYLIEKLLFQSRPSVWVTASAYVPEKVQGKIPAVLVVHGHWAWARRDPVVQARCLGLVKLGFFVLAVDAFGAGERYVQPGPGTYHGALFGSTLWPIGQTLLGMQVYDNRRAVDYLRSRPEVDGDRLGITGASGGGNQSMYAGALDERFRAVVPVCSVGTYQAYLKAACCVCEVLPGALRFMEEGDVLALVAPRALLVINATRDALQFSVGEAEKGLARHRAVFKLYSAEEKVHHAIFESGHAYNQSMREAMYGWMNKWLKGEGDGKPIPEPQHAIEIPEDLRCFPDDSRPKDFLFPPTFAAREARLLLAKYTNRKPDHVQEWESSAIYIRDQFRRNFFGAVPKRRQSIARQGKPETVEGMTTTSVVLYPEPGLAMPLLVKRFAGGGSRKSACLFLHLDGKGETFKHPLATTLLNLGWTIAAPDLRATGDTRPAGDAIAGAPDHNSAEHALWIGRPLLGQWVVDVDCVLDWLAQQTNLDPRLLTVVGLGQAGVVAVCAAGLFEDRIDKVLTIGSPTSYVTQQAYASRSSMGILAPGILRLGDIPQLAALAAPRRLILADGLSPDGKKWTQQEMSDAFGFTREIYKVYKAGEMLTIKQESRFEELAALLT